MKTINEIVKNLLTLLAQKKYAEIESLTNGVRLKANDISDAIAQYGRTLIVPPEKAFELMNTIQVRTPGPEKWSVTMPLWTKEEGRSDLSIELTISLGNSVQLELDDIRVL